MKVSILTQPLGHNYGGLMQAYALQAYLRSIGCDVETLDRRRPEDRLSTIRRHMINFLRFSLGRIKSIPTKRKHDFVFSKLVGFRNQSITMSKPIRSEAQIRSYFREKAFDIVLVGSDQVWRPKYSPSIFNYYLDFLDDVVGSSVRMSYAASFGVDEWEYDAISTTTIKGLIDKFDAISVREDSAVELCKAYLGVSDARCVVDPTLLLSAVDYSKLIDESPANVNVECTAVLVYILNLSKEKRDAVAKVEDTLGISAFSIIPENKIEQVAADMLVSCQYPGVEQWLQSFRDANFVVTDSFHGCVFAIIFNKRFIALDNPVRGTTRILSLLRMFGLQKRLVATMDDINTQLMLSPIDWDYVNRVRELKSEEGKAFLGNIFSMRCGRG